MTTSHTDNPMMRSAARAAPTPMPAFAPVDNPPESWESARFEFPGAVVAFDDAADEVADEEVVEVAPAIIDPVVGAKSPINTSEAVVVNCDCLKRI